MKKNVQKKAEFSEKDIQSAILYIKNYTSIFPSRENAINYLQGMQGVSHIIAHEVVKKEKENE